MLPSLITEKQRDLKRENTYFQFVCGILYYHLFVLDLSVYERDEDNGTRVCSRCGAINSKFQAVCDCGKPGAQYERLVNTVTFMESEFCHLLCEWADINEGAYLARAKQLFMTLEDDVRRAVLAGAREWWDENNGL